uniref:Endolytic peptidoglycan transglycosylase RlpA n=1 Tax=Candidatus Kentrum sp. MB TaxID=2138164 RepID=A0A451BE89_9GAMM|nr:MAG: rare lipoprotein A [Candidatus Kentron sp. MB]VFK34150.1 MAG: rare lipoprotein A [Candidatus Kentron sp. MB]VFK76594.1 MAG: rare lipoprotein A [Candidatus Kentron sp. MB]
MPIAPRSHRRLRYWPLILALLVTGCDFLSKPDGPPAYPRLDPNNIPDAVPRVEPKSRYGNRSPYTVNGKRYHVQSGSKGYVKRGVASWYGSKFHGRRTSNGERYDMFGMTAAHRSLPLPTYVRITNLRNGREAVVRVNDRGPFHGNRLIDLSYAAAVKLGIVGRGTGLVEVRAIDPSAPAPVSASLQLSLDTPVRTTQPVSVPAPPRSEPGAMPSSPNGIYLQVGAFSNRDSALRLKNRLQTTLTHNIRIHAAQSQGRTLYKVQLGPFQDPAHLDRTGRELTRIGLDALQVRLPIVLE